LRIALVNQYYAPAEAATARLLADLGEHLAAAGHDVLAICSRRSYLDPSRRYPARQHIRGVRVVRIRSTGFGRSSGAGRLVDYASFLAGAALRLVLGRRVDVVVCLTTPPMVSLLGVLLGRLRGTRSCFWVMDVYPEVAFALGVLSPTSAAGRGFAALARWVLRRSDRVVALGETMAAKLASLGARDVAVVHNWVDGEAIRPLPAAGHALRGAWGWQDRFVVLYSGNMGLAHDFETALSAAETLRDDPRILFAFVGGGPRRADAEREARRRGLANVVFKPPVAHEDLGQCLTAGDVHLVTSREGVEGLLVPSKIYGILAAGRPAIYVGPEDVELTRIVREGACGARLAVGDAAGLAASVREYAADPRRRAEEGARARRLFEDRFGRPRALAALRQVLESLGDGKP
jgi:glycosyltransferase involved in cell wall biosynthesis